MGEPAYPTWVFSDILRSKLKTSHTAQQPECGEQSSAWAFFSPIVNPPFLASVQSFPGIVWNCANALHLTSGCLCKRSTSCFWVSVQKCYILLLCVSVPELVYSVSSGSLLGNGIPWCYSYSDWPEESGFFISLFLINTMSHMSFQLPKVCRQSPVFL